MEFIQKVNKADGNVILYLGTKVIELTQNEYAVLATLVQEDEEDD